MDVIRSAEQLCKSDTRVLIQGETGVGKNLLAYIFEAYEQSKGRPFVELNCATIPAELLESELFGYAKGAFSGANSDKKGILEEANGGTLFLNEIAEMDSKMQAKLLQFLDDGSYRHVGDTRLRKLHTRVVCATNKNLWQQVEKGRFRRDLYFRLSQFVPKMSSVGFGTFRQFPYLLTVGKLPRSTSQLLATVLLSNSQGMSSLLLRRSSVCGLTTDV
jgi:two-component system response regulator PilR (NtrC family)